MKNNLNIYVTGHNDIDIICKTINIVMKSIDEK